MCVDNDLDLTLRLPSSSASSCFVTKMKTDNPQPNPYEIHITDPDDMERITDKTRKLGLVVVRGTQVSLVSPQEGVEEIANPFLAAEEEEEEEQAGDS